MLSIRMKLAVAGVVMAGAVAYLAVAGVQSGWVYYLPVHEYLASPAQYESRRVRLHGTVADDDYLSAGGGTLAARFHLVDKERVDQRVAVEYRGVVPDLFGAGKDVVVEGRLDPSTRTFKADVLMTKCASKYEPSSPHEAGPAAVAANDAR